MRPDGTPDDPRGWRKYLPAYGATPRVVTVREPVPVREHVREVVRVERRTSYMGWFVALLLAAGIAALVAVAMRDPRTVGTQLDQAVADARQAGTDAGQALKDSQNVVADASTGVVDGVKTSISDAGISVKVKTALAADPSLKASRIEVNTVDGVVRLEGPAPDAKAKDRATVLASAPEGVKGVDNRLTLPQGAQVVAVSPAVTVATPTPAPVALTGDAALNQRIESALTTDLTLARAKVAVTSQQGAVKLEGVVPDAASKDRALSIASVQPGVKSVDNRLLTNEAATLLARGNAEPTQAP